MLVLQLTRKSSRINIASEIWPTNIFILEDISGIFKIFSKTKVKQYLQKKTSQKVWCRVDFSGSLPL